MAASQNQEALQAGLLKANCTQISDSGGLSLRPALYRYNRYSQISYLSWNIILPEGPGINAGLAGWHTIDAATGSAFREINIFDPANQGHGIGKRTGWLLNALAQEMGLCTGFAATATDNYISNKHLAKHFGQFIGQKQNTFGLLNVYQCDLKNFQYPEARLLPLSRVLLEYL